MRIVYLVEDAAGLWGGVKSILVAANVLTDRGHAVTVLAKSPPPDWMALRCGFAQVPDFAPTRIPDADLVVGTFWTTVPAAVNARRGRAVHYCQGYEGFGAQDPAVRARIEQVYRTSATELVTISEHLAQTMRAQFGRTAHEVVYMIDHATFHPGAQRVGPRRLRIGLVGPTQVWWKDIATGLAACRLAHAAGLDLELVRITNTAFDAAERDLPFPVERHERVPPAQMGELYRSLDLFLGTSCGPEEGFFLPAVEAMACGVPCVLTDIPCFRGYGGDGYALFVPPSDPAAMAEGIIVASAGEVATALRANRLRTAQRYTTQAHVDALEQVFRTIACATPAEPDFVQALRERAEQLATHGDLDRASSHLRAALELAPADPRLWSLLAAMHWSAGDRSGALGALERAAAGGSGDAALHNDLGVFRFAGGDTDGARRAFECALALEPAHPDAARNLAALP